MKAHWIKTDGSSTPVDPKNGTDFQLDELQDFVRGTGSRGGESDTIDIVSLHPGQGNLKMIMVVNDDGHIIGLEPNDKATQLYRETGGFTPIVGNVLVCPASMVR